MADNTNNIPLDLYKLYREVCQRNGLPEVLKIAMQNKEQFNLHILHR